MPHGKIVRPSSRWRISVVPRDGKASCSTHMRFFLANHDRCLEVNMNNHQQLVVARLEEQMSDIAEQDVCGVCQNTPSPHSFTGTYRSSGNP